jgi:thioredoxin-like negative regulator of GroEL
MTDSSKPSAEFDQWFDALPEDDEAPYILAWQAYLRGRQEAAAEIDRLRAALREIEDSSNDPRAVREARAVLGGKP